MPIVYDSHIHLMPIHKKEDTPAEFKAKAAEAGIGGGLLFSYPPEGSSLWKDLPQMDWRTRIDNVLDFCAKLGDTFYPTFFWNPIAENACEQLDYAKNAGIRALKVLCSTHYPAEGLKAYCHAAELRLPIVFHSGILWDGVVSSDFNRPGRFECMLDVPGCRFALAHVSWPWTDECIALYGKIRDAQRGKYRGDEVPEMYVDCSPGAADIFREDIFRKFVLLRCGIEDRLMFAVDSYANDYNVEWAKYTLNFDDQMFRTLEEKYGDFEGFIPSDSPLANMSNEDRNPFRKTFENAKYKNMLRFIEPW